MAVLDYTSTNVALNFEEYLINEGRMFYFTERLTAQTGTLKYMIRTGALPVHINLTLTASVSTDINIVEGVTTTVVGTAIPTFNYLRPSAKTPLALVYKGPTYTLGNTIRQSRAGAGTSPGQGSTSSAGIPLKYVLKANTDYAFEHTPSASADLLYSAFFYEMVTEVGA